LEELSVSFEKETCANLKEEPNWQLQIVKGKNAHLEARV